MKAILPLFILILSIFSCSAPDKKFNVEKGISYELAKQRKDQIDSIIYRLSFQIPDKKDQPIHASNEISIVLKNMDHPVLLDFKEKESNIISVEVNEKPVDINFKNEHLILSENLRMGQNTFKIDFVAGELSLNRNKEYLYTLFVPERARTVFPCFDQPDLKASFHLTLEIPGNWNALSNAPVLEEKDSGGTKEIRYLPTEKISTYVFSFAAGDFDTITRSLNGRVMTLYHREQDSVVVTRNLVAIFNLHFNSLVWLEEYTGIDYPFAKFDFVLIPGFQYGGMEHAGAIQYRASSLFLDEGATQQQKLRRAQLIAHETSHMWFGNLVTMKWFNDVWMKEVFANFMADKIITPEFSDINHDLQFLISHYPRAYRIDRSEGNHPIRQELANLDNAGSLYGSIIYNKAPIMMRQLELMTGEEGMRDGLRKYLKDYSFDNAGWDDLISILDDQHQADLRIWSHSWVNTAGRPLFQFNQILNADQTLLGIHLEQKGTNENIWQQQFGITLFGENISEKMEIFSVAAAEDIFIESAIIKPEIAFNSNGKGYGIFPVISKDPVPLEADDLNRAASIINLYENMLYTENWKPFQVLKLYIRLLENENEKLIADLLTDYIQDIYWQYISSAQRESIHKKAENVFWKLTNEWDDPGMKSLFFKSYRNLVISAEGIDRLVEIWEGQMEIEGLKLSERDKMDLAFAISIRNHPNYPEILNRQLDSLNSEDRKIKMTFIIPSVSSDTAVLDSFFISLSKAENREKEPWVLETLNYLHHPLRDNYSIKYLSSSLEMLEEIQQTGDVFFPLNWLNGHLSSYNSNQAESIIRDFLKDNPDLDSKLKNKVLQAADPVFKANRMLNQ